MPQSVMNINGQDVNVRADDLIVEEELGRGAYGVVEKVTFCCVVFECLIYFFDKTKEQETLI